MDTDTITLSRDEYEALIDARDHAIAMRQVATGEMQTLTGAEVDAYLAAASPLAFWRKRRGLTQTELATKAGLSQSFVAQIEGNKREGSVNVLAQISRVLGLRIEDLFT